MAGIETLVIPYLCNDNYVDVELLFGRKKRGLFEGNLVFPGGKPELRHLDVPIEERDQTAARELFEETGLHATEFAFLGRLLISTQGSVDVQQVDVVATQIDANSRNEVQEEEKSDLEELQWHTLDSLPIDDLPSDYIAWFLPAYTAIEVRMTEAPRRLTFQAYIQKLPTAKRFVTVDWFVNGSRLSGIPQLLLDD